MAMADEFPEDSFFRNSNVAVLEAALQEKEIEDKDAKKLTAIRSETAKNNGNEGSTVISHFVTAKQLLMSRSSVSTSKGASYASVPADKLLEESMDLESAHQLKKGRTMGLTGKVSKTHVTRKTSKKIEKSKVDNNAEEERSSAGSSVPKKTDVLKDKNKSSYRPLNITKNTGLQSRQENLTFCDLSADSRITNFSSSFSSSLAEDNVRSSSSVLSTQQKLKLDAWGLPLTILRQYSKKGITEMFPWQVECLSCPRVLAGGNLVYSAPTSAGKTLVSEIVCIKTVLERRKKVLFVLPFVSVVREKMFHFQEIFRGSKVRVDGYMGGHSAPGGFQSLDLAVCTIEKANSLINRLMEEKELESLGAVVVDELHLIGDPHRGYLLELLLTKLKFMTLRNDKISIQVVGMSATLPNLSVLSTWLDADLYKTSYRPVPLEEFIKIGNTVYNSSFKPARTINPELVIKNDTEDIVYLCVETIANTHSVLIFCPTKAWCESLAQTVASEFRTIGLGRDINAPESLAFKLREQLNADRIGECLEQLRSCPVGLDKMLGKIVSFGVAYHHAGLSMDERDIIEGCFKNGTLRVLVATTTLSSGVNLPARRVIIRSPVFQGRPIDTLAYRQMVGRAGRMGVDSAGESIIICQKTEERIVENLVRSSLKPIESCLGQGDLAASLKRAVLEVIASGVASTPEDLDLYTDCTLLAASQERTERNNSPIVSCITFLEDNELIRLQTGEDGILYYTPTPLGQACLSASIHPDEGLRLFQELQRARQCFVLENELHLVYQVTPLGVADQWGNIDWLHVLALWEQLTPDMRRVGELVGVEDRFIVRAMRGTINVKLDKQRQKLMVHRRFYTALALHDLVNEIPLNSVASKFNCSRGMLQSLQQSAATYAGMVTSFCRRLGWSSVELLIDQFQDRLHFGTHRELLDLLSLPSLNGPRARALYNAGFTSVAELTTADVLAVENALHSTIPFLSDKGRDGETTSELERRKKLKGIWITGRQGLTAREATELLVQEARSFVQAKLGLPDLKWEQKEQEQSENSLSDSKNSLSGKHVTTISNGTCSDQGFSGDTVVEKIQTIGQEKSPRPEQEVNTPLSILDRSSPAAEYESSLFGSEEMLEHEKVQNEEGEQKILQKVEGELGSPNNLAQTVHSVQTIGTNLQSFNQSLLSFSKNASNDKLENNISDISNISGSMYNLPSPLVGKTESIFENNICDLSNTGDTMCNVPSLEIKTAETLQPCCVASPIATCSETLPNSLEKMFESFSNSAFTKLDEIKLYNEYSVNSHQKHQSSVNPLNSHADSCMEHWGVSVSALDQLCVKEENFMKTAVDTSANEQDVNTVSCYQKDVKSLNLFPSSNRRSSDLFASSPLTKIMSPAVTVQDVKESEDLFGSFVTPVSDRVLRPRSTGSGSNGKGKCHLFSDDSRSPSLFGDSFEINTGLMNVLDGNGGYEAPVTMKEDTNPVPSRALPTSKAGNYCDSIAEFAVPPSRKRQNEICRKFRGPSRDDKDFEISPEADKTAQAISPIKSISPNRKSSNFHLGLRRRKMTKQPVSKKEKVEASTSKEENKSEVLTDSFLEAAFQSAFDNDVKSTQKMSKPDQPNVNVKRIKLCESSDEEIIGSSQSQDVNGKTFSKHLNSSSLSNVLCKTQERTPKPAMIGPPLTRKMLAGRQKSIREVSCSRAEDSQNSDCHFLESKHSEFKNPFYCAPVEDWSTFNIIDVCRSNVLFKTFSKDILQTTVWSISLSCERNDVKSNATIGSKILKTSSRQEFNSQTSSQLTFGDTILKGVSICFGGTDAYYLSLEVVSKKCAVPLKDRLQLLQQVLCGDGKLSKPTVCCFDLKEQLKMFFRCTGIQMYDMSFCDPKIGDWLLEPEGKEKTFQAMVLKYVEQAIGLTDYAGYVHLGQGSPALDIDNTISGRQRSSVESILCYQMMSVQFELLQKAGLLSCFLELEMPVVGIISTMELTGIGFNPEIVQALQERLRSEMSALEIKAYQLAGRSFSLTSPADTARVLYQELRLGQGQSFKGRSRNTSKETLTKLRSEHPLPEVILMWRKLNAIHSKTVCPLLPVEPCSRLFGSYIMHTATGRITMHEPNIQCIPRDFDTSTESDEPFCMRSAFVASPGSLLVSADYSQLELRLLAHLSGEPKLRNILNSGQDVFNNLAASWFGISTAQVTGNHRQKAKQMCYGIIYGMGSKALADQLEVEESEAKDLMETFHSAFPGINKFLSKTVEQCREKGYVKTLLGRHRYLSGIKNFNIHVKAHAERQAVNTTVQGSAADLTKTAMIAVERIVYKTFPQALCSTSKEFSLSIPRLVLHLHDELMYEVPQNYADQFCQIIRHGMESAIPLSIKLPVKVKVGKSWGTLQENLH